MCQDFWDIQYTLSPYKLILALPNVMNLRRPINHVIVQVPAAEAHREVVEHEASPPHAQEDRIHR